MSEDQDRPFLVYRDGKDEVWVGRPGEVVKIDDWMFQRIVDKVGADQIGNVRVD